jgi:hypothetical protein
MASNTVITLNPFKRGDTPNFYFAFTNPYDGFDWSGVTVDAAMTAVVAPTDNTGAAATRIGQPLVTDANGAHFEFILTPTESNALVIGNYVVEVQLKESGTQVATPVTAKVKVLQDYVI